MVLVDMVLGFAGDGYQVVDLAGFGGGDWCADAACLLCSMEK